MNQAKLDEYWKKNLSIVTTLLIIWFVVGYVLSIILAVPLNKITFLGGPLGFWIAQNGAIFVFILLILTYCLRMNALDKEYDVEG